MLQISQNLTAAYRDFDFTQLIEEDVGWLEIVMNDAARGLIQVGKPIKDLASDCPCLLLRQYLQP